MTDLAAGGDDAGFVSAMTELEQILAEIESEQVDVDLLATRMRRAAELVRFCRSRISGAQMEVEQVVAELEGAQDRSDGAQGPANQRADEPAKNEEER